MKKLINGLGCLYGLWLAAGVVSPPILAFVMMVQAGHTWYGWWPWLTTGVAAVGSIFGTVMALYLYAAASERAAESKRWRYVNNSLLFLTPVITHFPIVFLYWALRH